MINRWILKLKSKIWFIPVLYGIIAFIFSLLIILIDTFPSELIQIYIPDILLTDFDLAKTILSALAAATITMMTVSFSTIMVVLSTYSSQYSPRTLQDFLNKKATLRILGIFIGTFIYLIISLLFLNENKENGLVLSGLMGVIISIFSVASFILFIHHVATYMQVNKLIYNISQESIALIKKLDAEVINDESIRYEKLHKMNDGNIKIQVLAPTTGYIQLIDSQSLVRIANELNISIKMEKKIGEFILKGSHILTVYTNKAMEDTDSIINQVTIGRHQSMVQDIEFGIQKLVEVALRAISPGINDPNTTVHCIKRLSLILSHISLSYIDTTYYHDKDDILRLTMKYSDFDELLYLSFYQIRYYGDGDASILSALIEGLCLLVESNIKIDKKIWRFAKYLVRGFNKTELENLDKQYINNKIEKLARLTGEDENDLLFN
ncbi:DUF2254 domain-containing protein [Clostridium sp. D2Q-11]|uniref:DUF2254 domain-containing protein n=1 Tax=Anaeromonas frigoriresistens TaxID=2683708 RepID=A0A942UYL0_9FIRM|nr:DUF2254 domain-containing protein [Anaeromonas frigoriresistens]MBS4539194.1 DUF2254 domain-containing protein [Anaeromonas frigoriresistens]